MGETLGMTNSQVLSKFAEVLDIYKEIAEDNELTEVPDFASLLEQMQYMVDVSHQLRKGWREGQAAPIGDAQFKLFLLQLIEASENVDTYEDVLNSPANKALKKMLEEKTEEGMSLLETALELVEEDDIQRSMLKLDEIEEIGELLSDAEVEERIKALNPTSPLDFFKQLFVKTKSQKAYRIVETNSLQNAQGDLLWGQYKSGLMELARHKSGRVGSKVLRHEFFHKVFWEYLTKAEQTYTLGLAKQLWGDIPLVQLEERMADDFADYKAEKPKLNVFKRVWRKLMEFLGFTTRHFNSLPELFDMINQGRFKNKGVKTNNVQRSMLQIGANFDSLAQFKLAKNALLGTFSELEKKRKKEGKVHSFAELVTITFDYLNELRKSPGTYYPS